MLEKGEYIDLIADSDGILQSRVFMGLRLAVVELLAGNMQGVLAVSQQELESSEHKKISEN